MFLRLWGPPLKKIFIMTPLAQLVKKKGLDTNYGIWCTVRYLTIALNNAIFHLIIPLTLKIVLGMPYKSLYIIALSPIYMLGMYSGNGF